MGVPFRARRAVLPFAAALLASGLLAAPSGTARAEPATPAQAASEAAPPPADIPAPRRGSGLPVPRFASLRADVVNLRTGPGTRYPIDWVFQRKGMPVEVINEFDTWRRIRDWQGTTGWVHQSVLTGKRGLVVVARDASLLRTPETDGTAVARLEPEVMGEILSCKDAWCRVRIEGTRGWIPRKAIWGVYANETLD